MKRAGRGWHGESRRHSLASKGIKTGRKKNLTQNKMDKESGREVNFKVFNINELEGEAKEKALENLRRDWQESMMLVEDTSNFMENELRQNGFDDINVEFWDLGRGQTLEFEGRADLKDFFGELEFTPNVEEAMQKGMEAEVIAKTRGERQEIMVEAVDFPDDMTDEEFEKVSEELDELERSARDDVRSIKRQILKDARDFQFDRLSDDSMEDFAQANEIEFTKNGNIFNEARFK